MSVIDYLLHRFHIRHNASCLPSHNHCFQFLLAITVVPRRIQYNGYAKFWGVNKVHYGLCEKVEFGNFGNLLVIWYIKRINIS